MATFGSLASDGGMFPFGDAGGTARQARVRGAATRRCALSGIFPFGDAPGLNRAIVDMARELTASPGPDVLRTDQPERVAEARG